MQVTCPYDEYYPTVRLKAIPQVNLLCGKNWVKDDMDKYEHRRAALGRLRRQLGRGAIARIGSKAGIDQSYISRLLYEPGKAGGKRMGEDTADLLDVAFPGWNSERGWQEGVDTVDTNVTPGPSAHGPYPVLTDVQAGGWTGLRGNFGRSDAEDWLLSARNLGPNGYMLRVSGRSMENPGGRYSFIEGMILHVNPDLDPVPGQFVIVRREGTDEGVFKRYIMLDGEPYLEAINPDWPKDRKFIKLQAGDVWCGVVVDASVGNLP